MNKISNELKKNTYCGSISGARLIAITAVASGIIGLGTSITKSLLNYKYSKMIKVNKNPITYGVSSSIIKSKII